MFGSIFGLLRPGALIDQEEIKIIDDQLAQLQKIPGWANLVATSVAPVEEQRRVEDSLLMFEYRVRQSKSQAPVSHLRYFSSLLERILQIAGQTSPIPTSAPAPAPVVQDTQAAPPPPPGLVCPDYNYQTFVAPANWNDPAAAQRYLDKYPDVKKAVVNLKVQPSAIWHYRCYGKKEGRTWAGLGGLRRPGFLRGFVN